MVREVAHFKLNDTAANTTVTNSVQGGTNGTSVRNTEDCSISTGVIGRAMEFAVSESDKVTVTHTNNLFTNGNVQSIALWFFGNKIAAVQRVFSFPASATGNRVYISITASDDFEFTIGTTSRTIKDTLEWTDAQWNHVVVVRDASQGRMKAYFNGTLIVDNTATITNPVGSTTNYYLGSISSSEFYEGYLDDVRIYDFELTQTHIDEIYNGGAGTENPLSAEPSSVEGDTGGIGTRAIANRYPIVEGLTAGTTRQVGDRYLVPQGGSFIRDIDKTLMY